MGEEPKQVMRVVLDSNSVVSALLFRGRTSALRDLWRDGTILPLASADIICEYASVMAYTKFQLHETEVQRLLEEELFPFLHPVAGKPIHLKWRPQDPDDLPFLYAAIHGKAEVLISGDRHLLSLNSRYSFAITPPGVFLDSLKLQ
jgi:putative PIN family toxin of toxin-antitoxin system